MESNSDGIPHLSSTEEEEREMASVLRTDLESQHRELRQRYRLLEDRVAETREQNRGLSSRIMQLNAEIEHLRGALQDLHLLDGFLRSGAVKLLNLESDPTLKVLLTSFLARALQTALDTNAVSFPTPRKTNGE